MFLPRPRGEFVVRFVIVAPRFTMQVEERRLHFFACLLIRCPFLVCRDNLAFTRRSPWARGLSAVLTCRCRSRETFDPRPLRRLADMGMLLAAPSKERFDPIRRFPRSEQVPPWQYYLSRPGIF